MGFFEKFSRITEPVDWFSQLNQLGLSSAYLAQNLAQNLAQHHLHRVIPGQPQLKLRVTAIHR